MTAQKYAGIQWEDPPPVPAKYSDALLLLRKNPGRWARITNVSSYFAYKLRKGELQGADADEFEATTRTEQDGSLTTWARYKPKPE